MSEQPNEVYYFGCIDDAGHYFWVPPGASLYGRQRPAIPWQDGDLDAKLAPGYIGPYQSGPQIEGRAKVHHKNGWTAVAFWDRSVDSRGGSNSVFIVKGTLDFDSAVEQARAAFPKVWGRFKFPVIEDKPDDGQAAQ